MGAAAREASAPWRQNIEATVMAVVMALFLKQFVIEAYKIPTGSMQPTLLGDEEADIKDRILVDKLAYVLGEPARWDVAVFRYPLDRSKTFVKRIAGVGPEELRIENGDVWCRAPGGDWHVPRRPRGVMAEHWKRLEGQEGVPPWIPVGSPHASEWSTSGTHLLARGSGSADFRGRQQSIVDTYLDGYPPQLVQWFAPHRGPSGENPVGDLRLEGTLTPLAGTTLVAFELREGGRVYRFELPGPAAPAEARARIDAGPSARPARADEGEPPAQRPFRLSAGRALAFALENLDDRLALELDGETFLAQEIEPARDQRSGITLEVEGEGADFDRLTVLRDIYYTPGNEATLAIPAGSFVMLGDNTQDSSDSREWTFADYEVTEPDGSIRLLRGNWRERENPLVTGHGEPDGPWIRLIDEWGERNWFRREDSRRLAPERAPFVPRALIQGRALAVFWPIDPVRGIWRLKWVD